jgi:DNA-binding transcriptional LysR family regulator
VELRHLRYFRVVAEELHFGRAAARLHMEPQPLNFQMKQLERELGFALLNRKDNRTHLTAAGEVLAAEAVKLLAAVDEALEAARRASRGESGVLRLGYANSRLYEMLLPVIREFRESCPAVSFEFQSVFVTDQFEALRHGRLDIGINLLPAADPAFASKTLLSCPPQIAVSANDPLAKQDEVQWEQLRGRPHVTLSGKTPAPFEQRMKAMLADRGVELRDGAVSHDSDSLFTSVALGLGIAVVPLEPRDLPHDVVFVPLPPDAPWFDYGVIWDAANDHPLRDRFIESLVALTLDEPTAQRVPQ